MIKSINLLTTTDDLSSMHVMEFIVTYEKISSILRSLLIFLFEMRLQERLRTCKPESRNKSFWDRIRLFLWYQTIHHFHLLSSWACSVGDIQIRMATHVVCGFLSQWSKEQKLHFKLRTKYLTELSQPKLLEILLAANGKEMKKTNPQKLEGKKKLDEF